MAKIQVLGLEGNKAKEISTDIFSGEIRKDIVQKIAEIERLREKQPYAPYLWQGMETSASGNVKHNRHVWKTDRGKGMSRFPKKRLSDKGERFVWVGAVISGTRGGRRAHPPKILKRELKINRKEARLGLISALAIISSTNELKARYSRLAESKIEIKLPIIVDSKIVSLKTKEFFNKLKNIVGEEFFEIAIQEKSVRSGIGKMRGRKYKKNAGLLLVIGNNETAKINGFDYVKAKDLKIYELCSGNNGARLCIFTEEAVKDLENKMKFLIGEKN